MLRFIDISNWQEGLELSRLSPPPDAVVCKATEGDGFIDWCCDGWVQWCIGSGVPFGFYHFAGVSDPAAEADFFVDNCEGYFGKGVPVLDWEGNQSVEWVNAFVRRVHERTRVWPWIYGNPWRFDQGGVEENCMRWVAEYPPYESPSWVDAESWACPEANGLVGAWQFCSDGKLKGYSGLLDLDIFYGDENAWSKYAGSSDMGSGDSAGDKNVATLENDEYRVTIERKQ